MKNEARQTRGIWRSVSWLRALVFAVPIILGACSDDVYTSMVMCFDENGLFIYISLDHPVSLPIDENDAYYIMQSSDCPCQGPLSLVGDYWQYPEHPAQGDCMIRINVYTGDVDCFSVR